MPPRAARFYSALLTDAVGTMHAAGPRQIENDSSSLENRTFPLFWAMEPVIDPPRIGIRFPSRTR